MWNSQARRRTTAGTSSSHLSWPGLAGASMILVPRESVASNLQKLALLNYFASSFHEMHNTADLHTGLVVARRFR